MVETTTATPPKEAMGQQQGTPQGSFLDPDVLIVLLIAVIIDILDVVLAIGVILNLILGGFLILWMVWKTGRLESAKDQIQNIRQSQQARQAARKKATRRAFRRGALFFLGGLVPLLSVFMLWTWAVINTVRGK
jgi:threonine/homoserine/homoserine lactone efflux protein